MDRGFLSHLAQATESLKTEGLFKQERVITSQQQADITINTGQHVLNFCANNYLGLANHPRLIKAAQKAVEQFGFGLASVRFICGTQSLHTELEQRLSAFLGTEDTILYSSCFDANGGLFETILSEEDAVISDALNHASIIDGIRLCKATRFRYANNDMTDLEKQLKEASASRFRLIATDGVFSMDGVIADLASICQLAETYQASVMFDDCHATGFLGVSGRGTHEFYQVMDKVDIVTGTLGKALGGASGGYTSGRKDIIGWLRQRSRPYLFSNAVAPAILGASLEVLNLLESPEGQERREKLWENTRYFRQKMENLGFVLVPGQHPIIPVMLGDARLAQLFAAELLKQGIYVIGFSYPVVPHGKARIRTQMSAAHDRQHLDQAIQAFATVGRQLGVIQ